MRTIPVILLLAMPVFSVYAEDKPSAEQEIRDLIQQLASPNPRPKAYPEDRIGPYPEYPPGYDRAAQQKPRNAFFELRAKGLAAFPQLIEHLSDARYSLTEDSGEAYRNWSVGQACYDIMNIQIQAFSNRYTATEPGKDLDGDFRTRARRPDYLRAFEIRDAQKARRWWNDRKTKTLRELQIEALQWVIAEEAKNPNNYSDEERDYLASKLSELRKSEQPLPPFHPWSK